MKIIVLILKILKIIAIVFAVVYILAIGLVLMYYFVFSKEVILVQYENENIALAYKNKKFNSSENFEDKYLFSSIKDKIYGNPCICSVFSKEMNFENLEFESFSIETNQGTILFQQSNFEEKTSLPPEFIDELNLYRQDYSIATSGIFSGILYEEMNKEENKYLILRYKIKGVEYVEKLNRIVKKMRALRM